jgi:hypothetical protein
MLLAKQKRKKKTLHSSARKGPEPSPSLVGLLSVLILLLFAVYVYIFHAALRYKAPNEAVMIHVPQLRPLSTKEPVERHAAVAKPKKDTNTTSSSSMTAKEIFVLTTSQGVIKIVLRPDLSKESMDYINAVVESGHCDRCNLYRAEQPGILQGVIENKAIHVPTAKGTCPVEARDVPNDCPGWDKGCGCHGPVMTRGMVGWAAGKTGPDFFIDNYKRPGRWWGTQHTVFGDIQDKESLDIVNHIIMDLPVTHQKDMTYLKEPLHFEMELIMS